ncbi:hypothetical protein CUZ95_2390 [Enterococcus lactis]|nr:hypothetical protein [Enterococcus lactis]
MVNILIYFSVSVFISYGYLLKLKTSTLTKKRKNSCST